jgi:ABC-type multidrug transport system fused ATPase/permease subunit
MANRNIYNQHNQNIRNQGGANSWSAEIHDEIYQNIDNLESQINSEISNKGVVQSANEQRYSGLQKMIDENKDESDKSIDNHAKKIEELDNKFKIFEGDALDKLSFHFEENYSTLNKEKVSWLRLVNVSFLIIILLDCCIFLAIYCLEDLMLQNGFYLFIPVNILGFTAFYFIVSQYSYYKKLALEYKNRSVVSKSYFGILNQSKQQKEREIITQIIADTLFSRNVTDQGAELPIKEIARIGEKILNR